mgnify:CR=1 FL=1
MSILASLKREGLEYDLSRTKDESQKFALCLRIRLFDHQNSIKTKEGQVVTLFAEGKNEEGIVVSRFSFEWSLKVK